MADPIDLGPAARRMAGLLDAVPDDRLGAPTPCPEYALGDLIDHIGGLAVAFTAAAAKDTARLSGGAPSGDGSRLEAGWRARIAGDLDRLAEAWRDPDAWTGMTRAGGLDLPGEIAGKVALNELVVHGWDVARAAGLPYQPDAAELETCRSFLAASAAQAPPDGSGPFGVPVDVPPDAPLLDQVIALAGRDPAGPAA